MHTTVNQHVASSGTQTANNHISLWSRFINWADGQEKSRLLWTALSIAGHGCVFTIVTMATILLTGNNFIYWPFALGAMTMCVVVNLAAMPTKITIPVLFFSLLIDITIIALCLSNGFDLGAMYR
jgi:hypothetical protein